MAGIGRAICAHRGGPHPMTGICGGWIVVLRLAWALLVEAPAS